MNGNQVDGSKQYKSRKVSATDNDPVGTMVKDIGVQAAAANVVDAGEDPQKELSLIEKVETGPWHKIILRRIQGPDFFGGYITVPNYGIGSPYHIPYEKPFWVPDYVVNILRESRRMETSFNRMVDNGEPKMQEEVTEQVCHPFEILQTVQGRPEEAKLRKAN